MGILTRFKEIMASNVNSVLDKLEDPSKMIDQILRNLAKDLAKVREETADIIAEEQRAARKLQECKDDITKYQNLAEQAVLKGEDDDARVFLKKKADLTTALSSLEEVYAAAAENSVKMKQMHDKLVSQMDELTARRDSIKAKVAVAKTQEHINQINQGSLDAANSIEAFDRMEEKADQMLDAANAKAELGKSSNAKLAELESKYDAKAGAVEDELAALKERLGKE